MTRKCNYHQYIDSYIDDIRNGTVLASNEIKLMCDYVENKLDNDDVFIDSEAIDKAVELMERYFQLKLLNWELFVTACIHCYYKSTDTVVFSTIFIVMGRGNGKNGFISPIAWYLTTHYHGISGYNIDIVANAEDQAKTSFLDIYEMLERTWMDEKNPNKGKSKKFFYKSKETIRNLKTKSYIKFNTSNAKTKDSKRTGCLIFDEVHQYENYDNIKVFTSGFGKRKHSRSFYITTNGNVREGVLDDMLAIARDVLNGEIEELRWLPLIYKIDKEEEALDQNMWEKANPSLPAFSTLLAEMQQQLIEMKYKPAMEEEFYTKRMNWPRGNKDIEVTATENLLATKKNMPDLTGESCSCGIDYTKINDMASVNLHFKDGDLRYDINHAWFCSKSADYSRVKMDNEKLMKMGLLTIVDDVEIAPELLTDWIGEMAEKYNITEIACDNFRYALLADALKKIGFDAREKKNVKLVRPSDIYKIVPVIESYFNNQRFIWGDQPLLRWATHNTKVITSGRKEGTDTGNRYYAKIEGKSRKTDPFMALVHSVVLEENIDESESAIADMPVYIY
ncbi:terminase large subunit [Eubacteriaceae bacterium ES2]|nr:terminase large subunit [Eubacteriaceae bacterium ES2]